MPMSTAHGNAVPSHAMTGHQGHELMVVTHEKWRQLRSGVCRQLWPLCACLSVLENASSASPRTEEHLIELLLPVRLPEACRSQPAAGQASQHSPAPTTSTAAMLVDSITALSAIMFSSHAQVVSNPSQLAGPDPGSSQDRGLQDSQDPSINELHAGAAGTSGEQKQGLCDCLHAALSAPDEPDAQQ